MTNNPWLDDFDRLPLAARHIIDQLCTRFEGDWRAGRSPRLEDYLLGMDVPTRRVLLAELLTLELEYRHRRGEAPLLPEYLERLPDQAEIVRNTFEEARVADPTHHDGAAGSTADTQAMPPPPPTVSGYEILAELGRGGMGVVYKARQDALNRVVALKMILSADLADPRTLARFLIEGELLARLRHPNIVQIYEVGQNRGRPYFTVEYVDGGTLDDYLQGKPLPAVEAARLTEQLARAVHHAHRQGVIHRDLKPANILIANCGLRTAELKGQSAIPKITDFGLSRPLDSAHGLTETGVVLGTPAYMSPEQARGESAIGIATDVYALGALLYQMLTGRPPFQGPSKVETLRRILEEEPPAPSKSNAAVPRDLETICLKCLEKDPGRRYPDAETLAEDLHRFAAGEPIRARPVRWPERLGKWGRRKPALAALMLTVCLSLLLGFIGIGGTLWYALAGWSEAEARRQDADARRVEADEARGRAESSSYFSAIARARLEWQLDNPAASAATLESCPTQQRGWEWRYLQTMHHADLLTIPTANPPYVLGVAFNVDGTRLATAGGGNPFYRTHGPASIRPGDVKLWNPRTGQHLHTLRGHDNVVTSVRFSADGQRLVTSSCDGTARVWDAGTGEQLLRLEQPDADPGLGLPVQDAAFSADGLLIASLVVPKFSVWNAKTGKRLVTLDHPPGNPTGLALTPDGKTLITFTTREARFWELPSGRPLPRPALECTWAGTLSPDGARLALPAGRHVKILDTETGKLLQILGGHAGSILAVGFSPDGAYVAAGSDDRSVRVWQASTATEAFTFRGHRGRVGCLAFHPDGHTLASGEQDPGDVKLWDLTEGPEHHRIEQGPAYALAFRDERLMVVGVFGLRIMDPPTGRVRASHFLDVARGDLVVPSRVACFSGDGRRLAHLTPDFCSVRLYQIDGLEPPRLLRQLPLQELKGFEVVLDHTGKRVATVDRDGGNARLRVWDGDTGQLVASSPLDADQARRPRGILALSLDGSKVAFGDFATAPVVRIVNVTDGQVCATLPGPSGTAGTCVFSPDGKRLAVGGRTGRADLWEVESSRRTLPAPLDGPSTLSDLAFSPDGRLLAAVSRDRTVVWEAVAGQEVMTLRGAPPRSADLAFNPYVGWSPDGGLLASANHDGSLSIWDAPETTGAGFAPESVRARRRERAAARVYDWHLREAQAALGMRDEQALAFHRQRLQNGLPASPWAYAERGRLFGRLGQFDAARRDYANALNGPSAPDEAALSCEYALLLLMDGDREGWRTQCVRIRERFGSAENALVIRDILNATLSAPVTGEEARHLIKLGKRLPPDPTRYSDYLKGLADFRAGDSQQAIKVLDPLARSPDAWWAPAVTTTLALAHRQIGKDDEARFWFRKAKDGFSELDSSSIGTLRFAPPQSTLAEWLSVISLRQEMRKQLATTP